MAFHIGGPILEPVQTCQLTLLLLGASVGLIAIALQAGSAIIQNVSLTILHGGEFSSAFTAKQL